MQQRKRRRRIGRKRITIIALAFFCILFLSMCEIDGEATPTPAPTSGPTPVTGAAGIWGESRFGEAVFGP
ncbi:MAG: hypothetical protein JXB88_10645 [Spirochaetales bacterium]|nr:hypothetical protein [Spirochaetales bacterium]